MALLPGAAHAVGSLTFCGDGDAFEAENSLLFI